MGEVSPPRRLNHFSAQGERTSEACSAASADVTPAGSCLARPADMKHNERVALAPQYVVK